MNRRGFLKTLSFAVVAIAAPVAALATSERFGKWVMTLHSPLWKREVFYDISQNRYILWYGFKDVYQTTWEWATPVHRTGLNIELLKHCDHCATLAFDRALTKDRNERKLYA
jgi:hypothetical protein